MKKHILSIAAILAASSALVAPAYAADSAAPSAPTSLLKRVLIDEATPYIDARYRFESVDQAGLSKNANASTLRTKFGYKTGKIYDFSLTAEIENVSYLGNDNFNNTVNGKGAYPTVADPDVTEVNHLFISYTGVEDTSFLLGRQPLNLDNQRFIGTVGWRQNDQTFDAATIINKSIADTTLMYSYISNINRIFSDDHPQGDLNTDTHVINASYNGIPYGKLTGYGYIVDINNAAVFGLSSKTFGARFNGSTQANEGVKLLYTAEYAVQTDHGDNPTNYNADYYHLQAGLGFKGITAKAGYEVLGSDNGAASFKTPLATLHAQNGWADKFLNTPANGLQDTYGSLFYKVNNTGSKLADGTVLGVVYHDFSADNGGADYGTEWDAVIKRNFMKHYSVMLKYADYQADTFATDTKKVWLQLGAKF
jgi:hypothetical protein